MSEIPGGKVVPGAGELDAGCSCGGFQACRNRHRCEGRDRVTDYLKSSRLTCPCAKDTDNGMPAIVGAAARATVTPPEGAGRSNTTEPLANRPASKTVENTVTEATSGPGVTAAGAAAAAYKKEEN